MGSTASEGLASNKWEVGCAVVGIVQFCNVSGLNGSIGGIDLGGFFKHLE